MNKILYSHPHLWVTMQDEIATIGIKDNLIEKFNTINFIELPEIALNINKEELFASIETDQEIIELFMPIGGTIIKTNNLLDSKILDQNDIFNYWLIKIKPFNYANDILNLSEK